MHSAIESQSHALFSLPYEPLFPKLCMVGNGETNIIKYVWFMARFKRDWSIILHSPFTTIQTLSENKGPRGQTVRGMTSALYSRTWIRSQTTVFKFCFYENKKKPQGEASSARTEMQESIKGRFLQNTGDAWEDLITSVTHTMAFA